MFPYDAQNINAYLKTSLSPYQLNTDSMSLVRKLEKRYSLETEEKAVILLNAAELHPSMSKYQLSLTHKAIGDIDYQNGFYGSALAHYETALSYNQKLSVKRRLKELLAVPKEERKFSCSPDLVANVLAFDEYAQWRAEFQEQTPIEHTEDNVYDSGFDAEIMDRVEALDELSRSEFWRLMEKRKLTHRQDDPLSLKDYALLDLQAIERAANARGVTKRWRDRESRRMNLWPAGTSTGSA